MIEGIIVFLINGEEYAIDLQQVPVITKADKYFRSNPFNNGRNPSLNFDNKQIELIDIRSDLGYVSQDINENSRIILFERGFDYFGIIVDKIKYILNIDHKSFEQGDTNRSGFISEINYGNSVYKLLNLNMMTVKQS